MPQKALQRDGSNPHKYIWQTTTGIRLTAERDVLHDGHVVPHTRRLADDDARAVVQQQALAQRGARVHVDRQHLAYPRLQRHRHDLHNDAVAII